MMRKTCQPKNNVEDGKLKKSVEFVILIVACFHITYIFSDKIDPIAKGIFIDEKEVKCYMACIMKMANTVSINY